jgi:hypothetical protein
MSHFGRLTLAATLTGLIAGAASSQEVPGAPQGIAGQSVQPSSITIAYSQYLWPKVNGVATVYYQIDSASDPNATQKITNAINTFNADFRNVIQWVSPPPSGANYVDIDLSATDTSGVCEANEGYEAIQGQPMTGSTDCTEGTILHEMGHVIGLWHEQSRPDRATYIALNYSNVVKGSWSNFLAATDDQQILGPYDYASVMQYIPYAFSANGRPVIESIPAGIPLSGYAGVPSLETATPAQPAYDYSAGDKETIKRLYGAAPTQIAVTSNPVGLSVIVDGVTVTTPQTYSWPLYSTHTLDVSSTVQTLSGAILSSDPVGDPQDADTTYYYTFGLWNNAAPSTTASQTITVTPGNGSLPFPTTAPQLSTYSANFIQLVPYTSSISPASSGTVSVSPQPQSYSGVPYFVARELVTLTASPTSGWNFYEFNNSPFWLPGGLGANPKSFNVPDTGLPVNTTVEFSNTPVYTVDVTPETYSANMGVTVDGTDFAYTPINFSSFYDSTWTVNSQHSLNIAPVQKPYSFDSRFNFVSWSDGGAISHSVTVPGVNHKYIATVTREYQPATNFSFPPCGGTATVTPASTDNGFYPYDQELTFNATADSGWTFAGWTYDLTGKSNPATLTADGETLVYANFNTVAAPLTLTALSPASVAVGNAAFTLTLVGTGFSPSSFVIINNQQRTFTYVNSARLQVPMTAQDASTLGGYQVYVENFPAGWTGCAVLAYQTLLVRGRGAPAPTPVFSPKSGSYANTQDVSITDLPLTSPTPSIYYTTDGSLPTTSSTLYSGPIAISATTTLKAAAYSTGYTRSATALATYTIETLTATPTLLLPGGQYSGPQTLQITDTKSPGAIINYTTDGSTPTASSPQYTGPITISSTETVKANALASGHLRSFTASASYTIN